MVEPMNDEELADLEAEANYENIETTTPKQWESEVVLRLVREVRRLRCALHEAQADADYGNHGIDGACPWGDARNECQHCSGRCGGQHS